MLRSYLLIFCVLVLMCGRITVVFAQDFIVNGVVFDRDNKQRLAAAEVKNFRNGYSVQTNELGLFNLKASLGDTLLFRKKGFDEQLKVVVSKADLLVYLNTGINLNTVEIRGERKITTLDAIRKDYKGKGSFYAGKPSFLSFIFTPITAVYELFGRTPRNARRFNRYYVNEVQQTHVDQFFNRSLISRQTGLTGAALDTFMMNYRPEYEQTKNWTNYDGLKWIKESFKKYSDTAKR